MPATAALFSKFTLQCELMLEKVIRILLLVLHALLNVYVISMLTKYDLSASWSLMAVFVLCLAVLLLSIILHILSFLTFLKRQAK